MIAYVEGRLAEVCGDACLVVTSGGVGYEIFVPAHTLAGLPEPGADVRFYTVHVVREDAQALYGFESWDERLTFRALLSISKVGARTALALLSVFRPDDLRQLAADENPQALTAVPGIGKKTAQHIFLELKYKLKAEAAAAPLSRGAPGGVYRDVLAGLTGLGYSEEEAGPLIKSILHDEPDLDVGEALRAVLKALARSRS